MNELTRDAAATASDHEARVAEAAEALASVGRGRPRIGIILGSGLGAVVDVVTPVGHLAYAELPGFPRPTVAGHTGQVTLGVVDASCLPHGYGQNAGVRWHIPARWIDRPGRRSAGRRGQLPRGAACRSTVLSPLRRPARRARAALRGEAI